jgi:hypothetical protein
METVAVILRLVGFLYILVGCKRAFCNLMICRDLLRKWRGTSRMSRGDVKTYFIWFFVFMVSVFALTVIRLRGAGFIGNGVI